MVLFLVAVNISLFLHDVTSIIEFFSKEIRLFYSLEITWDCFVIIFT